MWQTTGSVDAFLEAAGEHMRADAARHTLLLTISEMLVRRGAHAYGDEGPQFGWFESGDGIEGTFLVTPPWPLLLGPGSEEAARTLGSAVADRPLEAFNAPAELAGAVESGFGRAAQITRREILHRLGEIVDPASPPAGRAIVAGEEHRAELRGFLSAFAAGIGEPARDVDGLVQDGLSHGGLHLWTIEGGEPVCMVGHTRRIAGMVRIAPVYTPPEHRGRGYAGALTAAVSHRVRDAGAHEILLFTDATNPTAIGVYRRVGYVPVSERVSGRFTGG